MDSLVGFRFHPTDEEIILLLTLKRFDPGFSVRTIKEIDLYSFEPWELPWHSEIQSEEEVWYFFCEPYYKYAKSKRANRRTKEGYWKKTGNGSKIKRKYSTEVIGTKKILSFLRDDTAAKKAKTEWVIHEIAVEDSPDYEKDFVVCRLERKRDKKHDVSKDQSSQILTSERNHEDLVSNRNHLVESTVLVSEVQAKGHMNRVVENTVLVSDDQARDHRNHVAENTVENSAKTRQLAEFNPQGGGYNGLSDASFPALRPPVYSEQESSCANGSSYGSGLLNSQFDGEQVDGQFNSRRDFQNEYSSDETGQTTPDFFSSKSDEGVFLEDSSEPSPSMNG
ncbi:NAC domain-containing protein 100 [Citrus sinensis]|uniref:NAC domain-containing protein 100 n=1 Tax=Citrus sinensis TaxID=2711 RepID=A0ACB8L9F6_CITSI|nr:NAC domain-containing protein 100 [Citrus sinensis]